MLLRAGSVASLEDKQRPFFSFFPLCNSLFIWSQRRAQGTSEIFRHELLLPYLQAPPSLQYQMSLAWEYSWHPEAASSGSHWSWLRLGHCLQPGWGTALAPGGWSKGLQGLRCPAGHCHLHGQEGVLQVWWGNRTQHLPLALSFQDQVRGVFPFHNHGHDLINCQLIKG